MFLQKGLDENFKLFDIFIRHAWRMVQFLHQNAWSRIMVLMVCCAGHLALNVLKFATACIQWTHWEAWIPSLSSRYVNTKCVRHWAGRVVSTLFLWTVPHWPLATPGTEQLYCSFPKNSRCRVMELWDECYLLSRYLATSLVWSWILRQLKRPSFWEPAPEFPWHV